MSKKATCSIKFNNETKTPEALNFLCWDNKIHIRFRDFNKPIVLYGFEQKLTYLLTYLIHQYTLVEQLQVSDLSDFRIDEYVQVLVESPDFKQIWNSIQSSTAFSSLGIIFQKNYKKGIYNPFGKINKDFFPTNVSSDNAVYKSYLEIFLQYFLIDLNSFLFDDRYSIVLEKIAYEKINKKFLNKRRHREVTRLSDSTRIIDLWGEGL